MFQQSGECVNVHYLSIQVVRKTLPCFFSLLYHCGGISFLFNYYVFYLLIFLHEDFCLWREKAALLAMVNKWICDRWRGLFEGALSAHLSRIGFTWLDESVSAHPGLVFVQPIKPGRSCFGFIELSSVTYPGCLNPTFVQWAPGSLHMNTNMENIICVHRVY